MWERGSTSDALIGSARVSVTNSLRTDASDGWHRLVGTGDQVGAPIASVDALRLSLGLMRSIASVPS